MWVFKPHLSDDILYPVDSLCVGFMNIQEEPGGGKSLTPRPQGSFPTDCGHSTPAFVSTAVSHAVSSFEFHLLDLRRKLMRIRVVRRRVS